MTYKMYSVKDSKVGFMIPTCDMSDQSAIRNFSYAVNANNGMMNYSPKDFDLYCIGEFDDEKGEINSKIPEFIVSGSSIYGVNDD